MSSYFTLELDTTPPRLSITIPKQILIDGKAEVLIEANESLMDYLELYLIDAHGNKHNFNLSFYGTYYAGILDFTGIPAGMSMLYVRLKDEVANISPIITEAILFSGNFEMKLVSDGKNRLQVLNKYSNNINIIPKNSNEVKVVSTGVNRVVVLND